MAPGAFDPLSARLVEEAGFPAVYMTGFGTSAALIGRPDVGLLTMTEMVGNAGRIAACVDIPVIADADTGYGNPLNVIRTVGAYEAAGVAGIHIEDQVAPKKCGHMEGKLVIPAEEMAEKVRAAVEARTQPEFVIIARTDARAVEGLERALERGRMYREAGADVLFIEASDQRGRSGGGGAGLSRRAAAVQLGGGGQDPADQPGPPDGNGISDRHLSHRHVAGGYRGHAADTAGDRPGGHAGRGDSRVAHVRGVRGFHRAAPGARGSSSGTPSRPAGAGASETGGADGSDI